MSETTRKSVNVYEVIHKLESEEPTELPTAYDVAQTVNDAIETTHLRTDQHVEKPLHPWLSMYPHALLGITEKIQELQSTASGYTKLTDLQNNYTNITAQQEQIWAELRTLQIPGVILTNEQKERELELISMSRGLREGLETVAHLLQGSSELPIESIPLQEQLLVKQRASLGQIGQSLYSLDRIINMTINYHSELRSYVKHLSSPDIEDHSGNTHIIQEEHPTPKPVEGQISLLEAVNRYLGSQISVDLDQSIFETIIEEEQLPTKYEEKRTIDALFDPTAVKQRLLYEFVQDGIIRTKEEILEALYPELIAEGKMSQAETNFRYVMSAVNNTLRKHYLPELKGLRGENKRTVVGYRLDIPETGVGLTEHTDATVEEGQSTMTTVVNQEKDSLIPIEVTQAPLPVDAKPVTQLREPDIIQGGRRFYHLQGAPTNMFVDHEGFVYRRQVDGMKPHIVSSIHLTEDDYKNLVSGGDIVDTRKETKSLQRQFSKAEQPLYEKIEGDMNLFTNSLGFVYLRDNSGQFIPVLKANGQPISYYEYRVLDEIEIQDLLSTKDKTPLESSPQSGTNDLSDIQVADKKYIRIDGINGEEVFLGEDHFLYRYHAGSNEMTPVLRNGIHVDQNDYWQGAEEDRVAAMQEQQKKQEQAEISEEIDLRDILRSLTGTQSGAYAEIRTSIMERYGFTSEETDVLMLEVIEKNELRGRAWTHALKAKNAVGHKIDSDISGLFDSAAEKKYNSQQSSSTK